MRQLLLMLPLLLTLLTSGCTTDFCIPILMDCGTLVEETHDVIVIESLQALPDNIPPGGSIKVVAIVSNVADIDAEIKDVPVTVRLYDYCQGMFELKSSSGGDKDCSGSECSSITTNLLRSEKAQVEWTLQARGRDQVPVKTECTLKVLARYPYATRSVTTLHMIDYAEMQRRISEGTYKEIGSYQSIGYGPIKPYINVEGTQPIPVSATGGDTEDSNEINTVLSLQVKNRGRGFLTTADGTGIPVITDDMFNVTALTQDTIANDIAGQLEECKFPSEGLKLIKGESTKVMCEITKVQGGKVPVESTKTIQASLGEITTKDGGEFDTSKAYWYEFRKEIKVTVEPTF